MKDQFSKKSDLYVKFRPSYPKEVFDFILNLVSAKNLAWDAGTGNGQIAEVLSTYFDQVVATDISEKQILNAKKNEKIIYKVESAEKTCFPDDHFDLITVAQAIHWFDFSAFYSEVRRTIKRNGILAVIGYGLLETDPEIQKWILHFYSGILGKYWDKERRYIDENYKTIPFPFEEIPVPTIFNDFEWTIEQMIGYLETWSAIQNYIEEKNENPLDSVLNDLKSLWGEGKKRMVRFPILFRVARI
ncbi:class I SAM-dependent methyltransferase [Leptospira ilyithenensis]|uniref:Class I SAM-dependent methyltransferase n=1 Tax=Leptospira ilyithenensis TaxID=2484901 RepID=A0A4R9LNZ0_9LEPT|nr:class I SAM-dependent methyltransferase [Leptospira ilyithenensis]TGN09431.1 class I SAM-dependent methyltransferase [Leptospira ilyithenensis]